jgi:hypothetical protein
MIVSRRMILVAVCAAMFGLATPLWAQSADAITPATAPTTGTFVFNFTITASSAVPKNGVISCHSSASVFESSSGQNIQQDAHGIATLSGGKWICKANMPYSWVLASPSSDNVNLSYSVELDDGLEVTATNGTATLVVPNSIDKVSQGIGSIKVPLNGSTTTETIASTI